MFWVLFRLPQREAILMSTHTIYFCILVLAYLNKSSKDWSKISDFIRCNKDIVQTVLEKLNMEAESPIRLRDSHSHKHFVSIRNNTKY